MVTHATPVHATAQLLDGSHRSPQLLAGAFLAGYGSPNTRDAYRHDIARWLRFCDQHQLAPLDADRAAASLFMRWLEQPERNRGNGYQPATRFRTLTTLRCWYQWLVDEEYLLRNPWTKIKAPHVPRESSTAWLTRHELADWMAAAKAEGGYTYALAALLAHGALRISEACGADITDLHAEDWRTMLSIVGKGDRPATVPLTAEASYAVQRAIEGRTAGPLLLNSYGNRMTRDNAGRIVARLARVIGCEKNITPHSLRHSAITAAFNAGVSSRDVQDLARHANPTTTQRYDRDRGNPNRHAGQVVAQWISGAA